LQDLKELKESIEHNASCLGIGLDQLIGKEWYRWKKSY
jgi:hypothetical protein